MNFERLNKKAIACMYTATAISCIIISIICWTVFFLVKNETIPLTGATGRRIAMIICVIVFIAELLETCISPYFRYQRYRYSLTDEEVQIKEGYIFLQHTIVPISRLHKINIQAGPLDRLYGLAQVEITTAGGDITIKFLEKEKAEQIADKLKTRINHIVEQENRNGK